MGAVARGELGIDANKIIAAGGSAGAHWPRPRPYWKISMRPRTIGACRAGRMRSCCSIRC